MTTSKKQFERFLIQILLISLPLILALGGLMACNKATQPASQPPQAAAAPAPSASTPLAMNDENAIRKAVEDHVRSNPGINMSAMDMSVDGIKISGDQAQANATFRLKQGGTSMTMTYSLSRHADGWLVVKNQPGDGQFVHPPMDKNHSGAVPNSAAPDFPDMREFMKQQPPPNKN